MHSTCTRLTFFICLAEKGHFAKDRWSPCLLCNDNDEDDGCDNDDDDDDGDDNDGNDDVDDNVHDDVIDRKTH